MKTPIVILHGWRKLASDYLAIKEIFEDKGYNVLVPDLPGNSKQELIKEVMNIEDYAEWLKNYLDKKNIKKAIFVCHSFGGRVCAKLAVKYPERIEKIIFTGTPLVKQKRSIKKRALVLIAGFFKKFLLISFGFGTESLRKALYYLIGEWDYIKAPENIKETFKAVIAERSEVYLPLIKAKTFVLWGNNDKFVPKLVGKKIAQLIPNAVYKEITGTHRLPYENPEEFAKEVLKFI